jgi:transposase-like protein
MTNNEFYQAISLDFAPASSQCVWCSKPAETKLTAIGGTYHNKSGFFCRSCGQEFTRMILDALKQKVPVVEPTDVWSSAQEQEISIGQD